MKVVTIIGARPQFIKAAPVATALKEAGISEVLVDTGQHYDANMAGDFVREFGMAPPAYCLGVGSGRHGVMTGRMLERAEDVLMRERPDAVLVYGDTNSTLAGALAAAKLALPVAHIEAGLRSRKATMPEEINRRLTDHISTILFCPTATAVKNLKQEGIAATYDKDVLCGIAELRSLKRSVRPIVVNIGDVMVDALNFQRERLGPRPPLPGLEASSYALVTVHRAEATDDAATLKGLVSAFSELAAAMPVVFPVHPRTKAAMERYGLTLDASVRATPPLSHAEFIGLLAHAGVLVTDSGGAQKEAFIMKVPCLTLRSETEWEETVASGWNVLIGSRPQDLPAKVRSFRRPPDMASGFLGDGAASARIAATLNSVFATAQ